MPEQNSKEATRLQPLMKGEFLRLSSLSTRLSQYSIDSIPSHAHDNIGSQPIAYSNLIGVRGILVTNTVNLSSAQIKALHTTPIVLVKNPGARSFVFVEGIAGRLRFGTTAYTGANNLEFRYTDGSGLKVCEDMPALQFLKSTSSTYSYSPFNVLQGRIVDYNFTPIGGDTGNNGQVVVSVPIANPATGDSTITLVVY